MKINFNKKTGKNEWILDRWYNKAVFVAGIIYFAGLIIVIWNRSI